MNALLARIAYELIATPSTSVCGVAIISGMSLQVPGSDSSALTTRYFGFGLSCGMKLHFMPVGKPAPPRPRRPESFTAPITSSCDIDSAFFSASYPPRASYDARVHARSASQLSVRIGVSVSVIRLLRRGLGLGARRVGVLDGVALVVGDGTGIAGGGARGRRPAL